MSDEITHAYIVERLDALEERLDPLLEAWKDITILGRYARIVGRSIVWTASMVVVVMAAWTIINGG